MSKSKLSKRDLVARWLYETYGDYEANVGPDGVPDFQDLAQRTRQEWEADATDLDEYLKKWLDA